MSEETHEILPGNIDTTNLLAAKGFQPVFQENGDAWVLFSSHGGPTIGIHEVDLLKAAEIIVKEKPNSTWPCGR